MHCFLHQQIELAKVFEEKVLKDERFEVHGNATMGLVCFRLQVVMKDIMIQDNTIQCNAIIPDYSLKRKFSCLPLTTNNKYIKTLLNTVKYDTVQKTTTILYYSLKRKFSCLPLTTNNKYIKTLLNTIQYDTVQKKQYYSLKRKFSCLPLTTNNKYIKTLLNTVQYLSLIHI